MTGGLLKCTRSLASLAAAAPGRNIVAHKICFPSPLPPCAQAYWLCASLATGALLKVRTIGLREGGLLLRLGDALIFFAPLHDTLGDTLASMLPVNITVRV